MEATAPGKVMLLGEYAVLDGQPALVMAANRRVRVRHQPAAQWALCSDGQPPEAPGSARNPVTDLLRVHGIRIDSASAAAGPLAPGLLQVDSRALQEGGSKLGLGSSAAVSVAMAALLATCRRQPLPDLASCIATHDRLQGTAGSGFDVAAALHGGWFRFQRGAACATTTAVAPPAVPMAFVWTGTIARTTGFIRRFRQWQQEDSAAPTLLRAMGAATESALAAADTDSWLSAFHAFELGLRELARRSGLTIWGGGHERLADLAASVGVQYKPCGAGGGDLGVAVADSVTRLERFLAAADKAGFKPMQLECDPHGVRVEY